MHAHVATSTVSIACALIAHDTHEIVTQIIHSRTFHNSVLRTLKAYLTT